MLPISTTELLGKFKKSAAALPFGRCPLTVYHAPNRQCRPFHRCNLRLQLRTIAEALGLDPAALVPDSAPDARDTTQPIPVVAVPEEPQHDGLRISLAHLGGIDRLLQRRRGANWTAAMLVALVAAVAVLIAILAMRTGAADPGVPDLPAGPQSSISTPASATTVPTQAAARTDDTLPDGQGVEVTVRAVNERSWVSVTGSKDAALFDGLVAKGEQRTFRDASLVRIVIGNAGAVTLTVNGKDLGEPGRLGDVASLEFTPDSPSTTLG